VQQAQQHTCEAAQESRGQDVHEAGQDDDVRAGVGDMRGERFVILGAGLARILVR
jgi:hypothetical protein